MSLGDIVERVRSRLFFEVFWGFARHARSGRFGIRRPRYSIVPACLAGSETFVEATRNSTFCADFAPLRKGPRRTTTLATSWRRLMSRLSSVASWLRSRENSPISASPPGRHLGRPIHLNRRVSGVAAKVIAIDGKTVRRSKGAKAAIHMVSASRRASLWCWAKKANEIVAIPKGAIVTLDAMGCQRAIAQTIVDKRLITSWCHRR